MTNSSLTENKEQQTRSELLLSVAFYAMLTTL